jgi:hypothetical protein
MSKTLLKAAEALLAAARNKTEETVNAARTALGELTDKQRTEEFTSILAVLEKENITPEELKKAQEDAQKIVEANTPKAEKAPADAKESWKEWFTNHKFTIAGVVAGAAILGTAHYYGVLAPAAEATFEAIAGVLAAASTTQLVIAAVAAIAVIGGAYYASQHWGKKEEAKEKNEQAAGSAVGQ